MPVYRRKYKDKLTGKIRYGHYYYKFDLHGQTYKDTVMEARTKPQAELVERQAKQDIFDGVYDVKHRPVLFERFVEETYLPWTRQHHQRSDNAKYTSVPLCQYFKGKTLNQISPMMIEGYKQHRARHVTKFKTLLKPGSLNAELITLSGIFSMAVRNQMLRENPCEQVSLLEVEETPIRRLTDEEEQLIVQVDDPPYLGPMVQAALWTGFRLGELIALKKEKVDFQRDRIFVVNPKWKKDPRKSKGFPMTGLLRELMWRLCHEGTSAYVFPHPKGKMLNRWDVDVAFRRACHESGIYGFNFHKLRHEFGSRLGDADVNLKKIAELMGHASTKKTEIYVHPAEESLFRAAEVASRSHRSRIVPHRRKAVGDASG
jgi:integrase